MSEPMLIQFIGNKDSVRWQATGEGAQDAPLSQGTLADAAQQMDRRGCVVAVPGEQVLASSVKIPGGNRKRLLQAAPYAIEDRLMDDVEKMHFAIAPNGENTVVFSASKAHMDGWTSMLAEHNLEPHALIPDYLLLPLSENAWSARLDGDRLLVRTGEFTGFACDCANAELLIKTLLAEATDGPERIELHGTGVAPAALNSERLGVAIETVSDADSPTSTTLNARHPGNLLQGIYDRREQLGRRLRPWLPAAAMLLVALLLQLVFTTVEHYQLRGELSEQRTAMTSLYRELYPEARNIVNPRLQLDQKLAELRNAGGGDRSALALLERISRSLNNDTITIQGIALRGKRIDLDLHAADLQVIDQLKQALSRDGTLEVVIQSADTSNDGVDSRLQIEARDV